MEPLFQGEPKNVFWSVCTRNAEKLAACLKCKSNLPTLTVRAEGRHIAIVLS